MQKRRKGVLWVCAICLIVAVLSGCETLPKQLPPEELTVYASFYPIYILTSMIAQDVPNVSVHCLTQPQSGCLRDYSLSDWDAYLIASAADVLVLGGRGLESFEEDLVSAGIDVPTIVAFSGLTLENDGKTGDEETSHWSLENPYAYLSPELAEEALQNIAAGLILLDEGNREAYEANLIDLTQKLTELMRELAALTDTLDEKVILMHEGMGYIAEACNVEVAGKYAREAGQSFSSTELDVCLDALSNMDAQIVLVEDQAPVELVDALNNAGYTVVRVDVFTTAGDEDAVKRYFRAELSVAESLLEASTSLKKESY